MKKAQVPHGIHSFVSVADPRISPDGKHCVYVRTIRDTNQPTYKTELVQLDLESGKQILWTTENAQVRSPRWSRDGQTLAFLLVQEGASQLCIAAAEGHIHKVTEETQAIERFEWTASGTQLWVSGNLQKNPSQPSDANDVKQIGLIDTKINTLELVLTGKASYQLEAVSHDGYRVVYGLTEDTQFSQTLHLYNNETKQQKRITEREGLYNGASFSHDDLKLAFTGKFGHNATAAHAKLFVADLQTDTLVCLTEELDAPIGDIAWSDVHGTDTQAVVWTKHDHLYFQVSTMGDVRLYFASLDGMIFPASPDMEHVYGYDVSRDGEFAVVACSTSMKPGELYQLTITTGAYKILTFGNQKLLGSTAVVEAQPTITTGVNEMIHGWLLAPPERQTTGQYPLIVKVPECGNRMMANTFSYEGQILAANGLAVLYVNASGSQGYSQWLANANPQESYHEIATAVEETLQANSWIDATRIFVLGQEHAQRVKLNLQQKTITATHVPFVEAKRSRTAPLNLDDYETRLAHVIDFITMKSN